MEDRSFQLEGKAEHTEDDNSNVQRFHIQPNRISQLWWKAQRLVKLADVHKARANDGNMFTYSR